MHRDGAGTRSRGRLRYMSAAPRPQAGLSTQSRVHGIHECVVATAVRIIVVSNQVIVRFALLEGNDLLRQQLVDFMRGEGFPTVEDFAQGMGRLGLDYGMHMIGHDHP